ncbi:unnamed protein product [Wuchereria bancrofti]|uniref:Uncharacterized protein n=1 Tax=Wuchereria bancrofti TaxID=6293 RepID=A0A3P7EDD3_WUCBA|nr:unnamed protein product [Wuchereria bancrofti]
MSQYRRTGFRSSGGRGSQFEIGCLRCGVLAPRIFASSLDCNQDVAEVLFPNIIPMLSQLGSSVFIIELRVSFLVYFLVFNGRPVQISALEMIWE